VVGVNITEANDTTRLLRYLFALKDPAGQLPADHTVRDAAMRLASRVNKALHTGPTPAQVAAAWANVEVCPARDEAP
jgi:hypothetical protein